MSCKGDHLLRDCLGIPKVLEVWSDDHPPLPLASGSRIGGTSLTSNDKTHRKQGKITNPCKLCEGHHPIHLCPYMDEATRVLDNPTIFAPFLLVGYQKLSSSPPLVDSMISQDSSLVDPAPSEIQI